MMFNTGIGDRVPMASFADPIKEEIQNAGMHSAHRDLKRIRFAPIAYGQGQTDHHQAGMQKPATHGKTQAYTTAAIGFHRPKLWGIGNNP